MHRDHVGADNLTSLMQEMLGCDGEHRVRWTHPTD